jgi:hypothetical protein
MKKILLLLIGGLLLAGCSSVSKSNTLKAVALEPDIEPLPVAADLAVSGQKATGEASGKVKEKAKLEMEALAKALGQEPPSVDKPDVLVGMNVFTEVTNSDLKLTVTGYPAYYTNFRTAKEEDFQRLNIARLDSKTPSLGVAQGQEESEPKRNFDYYFTPKWQIPFTEGSSVLNLDLEGGWVWRDESFLGLEFNFSISDDDYMVGGGLNFGKAFDISSFQAIAGVSAGWWLFSHEETYCYYYSSYGRNCYDDEIENVYLLAPFARARWNGIELMYRLFLPIFPGADNVRQQFMIGYNFATSKRER